MTLKGQASLLFVIIALTGAISPANSAINTTKDRESALNAAPSEAGRLHDGSAPLGGRAVMTDWSPIAPTASLSNRDLYRTQAGRDETTRAGGLSGRLAARAASAESLAKVELGTSQWLMLTVVAGLLGAARRRPAR